MRVYKDTDLEFTFMPWELEPPKTTLIVVVKATFDLVHEGPSALADPQVPCLGEVPWDDGDPPSIRTETDYAMLKPKAEWYLTGSAHAVGSPATLVPVRVRIAGMEKTLTVWGDRAWSRGLMGSTPSAPVPFESMPLRWERSFGGPGIVANPVGRGTRPLEVDGGTIDPLPNIEARGQPIVSKDARMEPAGMFAIPCTWESRLRHTGTYDDVWKVSRWPFFPTDFDWAFFNCAPPDQQRKEYWRGDESIELTGLHRELAHLKTRLPALRARFFVEWVRASFQGDKTSLLERPELEAYGLPKLDDVPLRLDTIVIDSDEAQVMCQWRGLLPVANKELTDVMRFFVVHEPLETSEPMSHYEEWLQRKLLEEADEFAMDGPEEDDDGVADPAAAGGGELPPPEELVEFAALGAFGGVLYPQPPLPDVEQAREAYRDSEIGLDPDELLPLPEPAHTPDLPDAPSLLRLAAIIRRRLGKPFTNLDLTGAPYQNLDLSGVDFSGSILVDANLTRANLGRCVFDGASLVRAALYGVDFFEASLVGADLTEVKAADARFSRGKLDELTATDADFERAIFAQASMEGAELVGCNLRHCDFRETKLDSADLSDSNLEEANFSASSMVDTALEAVRARGALFERCRMPDLRGSDGADFSGAKFTLVDAPRAQFQGAVFVGASFAGSNLEEADFSGSRAEGVNLLRCVLRAAKLDRADLTRAQLMQADLFEASLEGAILSGADLRGAHLFSAHLWRAHVDGALLDGAILDRTVLGST